MVTIVLVDDHHLVRAALKLSLQAHGTFKIVGEGATGMEALDLVQSKKPAILLLDLTLPRMHGLDVIRQVTEGSRTKVIVVSMHTSESYVSEALKNGAAGYVLKESTPDELVKAIESVTAGKIYLSVSLPCRQVFAMLKADSASKKQAANPLTGLTRREKIVLQLAAEGNNNTSIGRRLSLSPRTVESHRASLMRKLKLRSQTEIVCFAVRKKLIAV
jgi:DNA-binding NarL/FixJ family response regulator